MKFLNAQTVEDPILSVVNLIDIFLVVIAALLLGMASNPLFQALMRQDVTVVVDAGQPSMEMIVKKGEEIERFKSSGQTGQGEGVKAGVAYRLQDGNVIYVPE